MFSNTNAQVIAQTKKEQRYTDWLVLKNGAYTHVPNTDFSQPDEKGRVKTQNRVSVEKNGVKFSSDILCDHTTGKIFVDFDSVLDEIR